MVSIMIQPMRYMTLTVQLADSRVLLHRKVRGCWKAWSVTHEAWLSESESPLNEANRMLTQNFGINPHAYYDDFAEIKQCAPITVASNRWIYPFTMKLKKMFKFTVPYEEEYRALDWYSIVDDVIIDKAQHNPSEPIFSPTAALLVAALNSRKVFN